MKSLIAQSMGHPEDQSDLKVMRSQAGFYIGTVYTGGGGSDRGIRESGYYHAEREAAAELKRMEAMEPEQYRLHLYGRAVSSDDVFMRRVLEAQLLDAMKNELGAAAARSRIDPILVADEATAPQLFNQAVSDVRNAIEERHQHEYETVHNGSGRSEELPSDLERRHRKELSAAGFWPLGLDVAATPQQLKDEVIVRQVRNGLAAEKAEKIAHIQEQQRAVARMKHGLDQARGPKR